MLPGLAQACDRHGSNKRVLRHSAGQPEVPFHRNLVLPHIDRAALNKYPPAELRGRDLAVL
jgi:hypothetical protein